MEKVAQVQVSQPNTSSPFPGKGENMKNFQKVMLCGCFLLAACAGTTSSVTPGSDYVEIDNPTVTMSPGAPAKIWVPRRYVEEGVPRGGEVIRRGVESVIGTAR